jgi:hypothetical protein
MEALLPAFFNTRVEAAPRDCGPIKQTELFKSPKTEHGPLPPASIATGSAITVAAASHPGLTFSARVGD